MMVVMVVAAVVVLEVVVMKTLDTKQGLEGGMTMVNKFFSSLFLYACFMTTFFPLIFILSFSSNTFCTVSLLSKVIIM